MAEGKSHKISGELVLNEEEKKEMTCNHDEARKWSSSGKSVEYVPWSDTNGDRVQMQRLVPQLTTSINRKQIVTDDRDTSDEGQGNAQSNMIVTGVPRKSVCNNKNLYIATCCAQLATVATGCVLTWTSPTKVKITKPGEKIYVSIEEIAWISSVVALGACVGPFIAGAIVDSLGRKWTIISDMFLFLISWLILAYSDVVYHLYGARFLAGIAVGCVFTVVPMYVAEISPQHLRSILGSTLQLFLSFGFLICYIIGPFTSYLTLVAFCGVTPFFCIASLIWIPESPYFLLDKNRRHEAMKALRWFRGYPEESLIYNEMAEMMVCSEEAKKKKGTIWALFSKWSNVKALYYTCALAFFQQFSGANIVLFYAEEIFEKTGSNIPPSVSAIIIGFVITITSIFVVPAAKNFSIRTLLLFSAVGETISLAGLGYYFYLKEFDDKNSTSLSWLPTTSLVSYIITYSLGFGPFLWVYMAEIFPSQLKALASSIVASFCWSLCFILTRYFDVFITKLGRAAAFGMFSIICVAAFFFTFFQLPNIHGKNYQEIQEMLAGKKQSSMSKMKA